MPDTQETLDKMAAEIFDLYRVIALARSRQPAGPDDLSEGEFLALDVVRRGEPLTIGEAQKQVGVLPAQMSRIIRSLEEQGGKGYVSCSINPQDRRRVDLSVTETGHQAHARYRDARLGSMYKILTVLPPDDRMHFMRILRQMKSAFEDYVPKD